MMYLLGTLLAMYPTSGSASRKTIPKTDFKSPVSAYVPTKEKRKIGIRASTNPQPVQRIAVAHDMRFTPIGTLGIKIDLRKFMF